MKRKSEIEFRSKNRKRRNLFVGFGILGMVFMMTLIGQIELSTEPVYTFQSGTYINGNDISGYTIERASQVVSDRLKEQTSGLNIEISYKDKSWIFTEDDFELDDSIKQVVQNAYNVSSYKAEKEDLTNKNMYGSLVGSQKHFNISLKDTFKNFNEKIESIVKEIECEPKNASVNFNPDGEKMFVINEGVFGIKVDLEKLYSDLDNQFLKTKEIKVFINTKGIKPEIDSSYFENKLNLMSKFKTSLENSQEGRRHNVSLALSKFNGKVIKPNEQISFNGITGPQTAETGYKPAIVIVNGNYVSGIGGGICQASTTLYNACVLANLKIDEVHKHTLPVGYVELSLDAMVNEGYSDFVFTNNSENDIYIKSYVKGDDATVEIYGASIEDGIIVKRVAEFIGNIPHNGDKVIVDTDGTYSDKVLYKGEYYRLKYPREGYEAKAFKETYKDGKLINREEIRHEKYLPVDGIIIEGAKTPPKDYIIPESDIEFIKPQQIENTDSVEKVVDDIKQKNPTATNP